MKNLIELIGFFQIIYKSWYKYIRDIPSEERLTKLNTAGKKLQQKERKK